MEYEKNNNQKNKISVSEHPALLEHREFVNYVTKLEEQILHYIESKGYLTTDDQGYQNTAPMVKALSTEFPYTAIEDEKITMGILMVPKKSFWQKMNRSRPRGLIIGEIYFNGKTNYSEFKEQKKTNIKTNWIVNAFGKQYLPTLEILLETIPNPNHAKIEIVLTRDTPLVEREYSSYW